MSAPDVWVVKDDGSDLIRAAAIVGVGRDYNGNITARMAGGDQAAVTLVVGQSHGHAPTPANFHRQLVIVLAELGDTADAAVVRPVHDDERGWHWVIERP